MVTGKQVAGIVAVCAVVAGGLLYVDSKYSSLEGTYPGGPDEKWIIDGDTVKTNNKAWGELSVSPHTLHGPGYVYCNVTMAADYGNIDFVWGFNTSNEQPRSIELYDPRWVNSSRTHSYTFGNVTKWTATSEACEIGNEYNRLHYNITDTYCSNATCIKWTTIYDEFLGEKVSACVEEVCNKWSNEYRIAAFDSYDGNTITWTTVTPKRKYWTDISHTTQSVKYNWHSMNKWYYIRNIAMPAETTKTVRIWIDMPVTLGSGEDTKFFFAAKRTTDTLQEAIRSNRFMVLDPWYNASRSHRKTVNVTHVNSSCPDITDCTIFLNVTKESEMQSDFDDILFYETDGTAMPFEYENHTTNYGLFWVLVPTLTAASDTQFYMYYGNAAATSASNPEATWNVNHRMVQHIQEAPANGSVGHLDSTSNNNDGTPEGFDGTAASTVDGTGKIDGANQFDAANDYIDCGNDASTNVTNAITIEAWLNASEPQWNNKKQSILSKWGHAGTTEFQSMGSWSHYDYGTACGVDLDGFYGGVFDGRYVYFVPHHDGAAYAGDVMRYDTQGSFTTQGSWSHYDYGTACGVDLDGFQGAVFDGRYVYFVPYHDGAAYAGDVMRYDTQGSFTTQGSWSHYDYGTACGVDLDGLYGGVFDGRYVYFVPHHDGAAYAGDVMRYDTQGSFTTQGSWSHYDYGTACGADLDGFIGAVFDGRYVYFVPYHASGARYGDVMRYDTQGSFTTQGSWSHYDYGTACGVDLDGFYGGVFDGRYVYFVPHHDGAAYAGDVMRYDTQGSFTTQGSWSHYDYGTACGVDLDGFLGAVFDGRYVYFVPYHDGGARYGDVMRYDTQGSFTTQGSWSHYDYGTACGADLDGFVGAVFDGRYVYFVPHRNGAGEYGDVMRYDTIANNKASYSLDYTTAANSFGDTPKTITFKIPISGALRSVSYTGQLSALDDTFRYIVGTYDGKNISLYVDSVLVNSYTYTALANVLETSANVVIGGGDTDNQYCGGAIDEVRISNRVISSEEINQTYQLITNQSTYVTFGAGASGWTTPSISNVQNGSINSTAQYVNATINQSANNVVIYDTGATGATSTACAGQWSVTHACANASDGNWSSYAESAGALLAYAYFNHTVPAGTSQPESLWHVKDNAGHANLTIPTACWGATLYLRAMGSDIGNSMTWQCDNGPGWTTLRSSVANHAYEEEMSFKYISTWDNATAAPNITLTSLTPSTGYNFYVRACNVTNATLCSNSSVYTFTTESSGAVINCTDLGSDGTADNTITVCTDSSCNCTCDGTEDQEEINWALDNATAGDTVHVNACTYFINDSIWINNTNIILEGDGDSSILKFPNDCSDATHLEYERMICINANDTTIENIRFDGNTFNQTLPAGAEYLVIMSIKQNIWNTIIYQCDFVNTLTDAIIPGEPPYAYNVTVDNCYFFNVDHGGVEGSFINSQVTNNTFYIDTFQGSSQGMNSAVRIYHGHGNVIKNNIVKKCGGWNSIAFGIEIHSVNNNNCSGTLIENNTFVNLFTRGISFDTLGGTPSTDLSTMRDIVIRNNVIKGVQWSNPSFGQGIYIEGLWNNWTIENNVIYDARVGIEEDDEKPTAGDIAIKNNVIVENRQYGIWTNTSNLTLSYNDVWNNALGNYNGTSAGTGDITVDPLFANTATNDFHLKSQAGRWNGTHWVTDTVTSPCIDAGDPADAHTNEPAPNGSLINMGAYGNTVEASKSMETTPSISNVQNGSINSTAQYVNATINQSANNIVIYDTGSTNATSTACAGQWSVTHACANASDGNWSSYAESAGTMLAYAYFNHTVPAGTSQPESLWHVKDAAGHANVTVPAACWGTTLYLRATGNDTGNSITWQCDDGPGWTTLRSSVANHAYEEEMSFKYKSTWDNATAAPNITLTGLTPSTGYNFYVRACNVTNATLCSNSSVYTFTTAAGTSTNPVYACANEYVLVNNWSAAPETFVQIDANMTNDTAYSYYNGSTFIDYWSGYFFNNDTIVAKNDSCFIYFTADTTIDCVPHSGGVTIRNDVWHYTFLPGSVAKTLSEINASMVADGGDVWSLYRWVNSTESYNAIGTVQPNEGIIVYANNTFVWTI